MKSKKFLTTLLCLAMMVSIFAGLSVASAADASDFSDLKGHWAEEALTQAVENDLLQGSNGKLNPNDYLTRAQLAAIVVRAFEAQRQAPLTGFTDVSETAWYYKELSQAVAMGVLKGDAAGTIRPNDNITRQEAFAVITRLLLLADGSSSVLNTFADGAEVAQWARGATSAMVETGLVQGSQGKLNPTANITRAEFVTIFARAISNYERGELVTLPRAQHLVVTAPGVSVKGTVVDGDLYIADGVGDTVVVLEDVSIGGRLVIRGGAKVILKGSTTIGGDVIVQDGLDTEVVDETEASKDNGSDKDDSNHGGSVQPPLPIDPTEPEDKYEVTDKYTYDEVKSKFSDMGIEGAVKRYIELLQDPSYDPTNDGAVTGLDLSNTETFVDKDFVLKPSLFASLRNVSSSIISENRRLLWLGYTTGGVDCVNLKSGETLNFAADQLTGGDILLLVGDRKTTNVYVITTEGVTLIAR